jgi:hypothetical protein
MLGALCVTVIFIGTACSKSTDLGLLCLPDGFGLRERNGVPDPAALDRADGHRGLG